MALNVERPLMDDVNGKEAVVKTGFNAFREPFGVGPIGKVASRAAPMEKIRVSN